MEAMTGRSADSFDMTVTVALVLILPPSADPST